MRRLSYFFSLLVILSLLLSGCFKSTPPANHNHGNHDHLEDDYALAEQARLRNEPPFEPSELDLNITGPLNQVGQWGQVVTWPMSFASAATLPDGRILAWGANNKAYFNGGTSTYAAIWDPATGQIQTYNNTSHAMFCAVPTLTEAGEVFVVGGDGPENYRTSLFNYKTNSWQAIDNMATGRWYNGSLQLPNGQVFTALGTPGSRYPELWTKNQGWKFLNGIDLQGPILDYTSYGSENWFPQLTIAPNGQILHVGPTPKMHYIDPTGNGSIREAGAGITGWDANNSSGTIVMFDTGKLLTVGGQAGQNKATIVDMNGTTPQVTPITNMIQPRAFSNAVMLPNGEVLMVGGQGLNDGETRWFSDINSILTPEIWNPQTRSWRQVANHTVPRNYHSVALLMPDGRIFSGGGGLCGCNADHPNHEIYSPPYLFNTDGSLATRPVITNAPDRVSYGQTINVKTSMPVTKFSIIKLSATTHAYNTDLRFLNVPFSGSSGDYSLILESNANVLTPGYWMLFALNEQGTPSVAKVFQVSSSDAPKLTNPGQQTNTLGDNIDLQLEALSPNSHSLQYSATGLPNGLSISPSGRITGQTVTTGDYTVSVTVTDGTATIIETFSWTVKALSTYRYVRLEAISEVNGNPWASAAEINILDPKGNTISRTGWTVSTNSEEVDGLARYAIDGDPNSLWHTEWRRTNPRHPHWLIIDMKTEHDIGGLRYLPRKPTSINGTIADYRIYVSNDGMNWGSAISEGRFATDHSEKTVLFSTFNVAPGGVATQSSLGYGGIPSRAIDTNISGNYSVTNGTITHTLLDTNAWWELDLGQTHDLKTVNIWNRADCCSERLSNFHLFVSDVPFASKGLAATQAQTGVSDFSYPNTSGRLTSMAVNRSGRYLRIQLSGRNYLSLAEVEVFATIASTPALPLQLAPLSSAPKASGAAVSYIASYNGGTNPRFKWLFGDGTPETAYSSSPAIAHSFSQPGRYVATLTATDDTGAVKTIQFVQMIHAPLSAQRPSVSSSILYETRDGNDRVWNVNPDNNTVSVIDTVTKSKLREIAVGNRPSAIALGPNGRIWVSNKRDASISIIASDSLALVATLKLPYGSQPYGLSFDPARSYAYVSLEATGKLLKLNAAGSVIGELVLGPNPRHLSVSADGNKVYISRFITPPVPGEASATPQLNAGGGEVLVVNANTMSLISTIRLQYSNRTDTEFSGRGIPNYLGPAVLSPDGLSAWVPSKQDNIARGSLRDGRNLTFESTVRSISSRIDLQSAREDYPARIDFNNGGIASNGSFGRYGNYLFVTLEGSREIAVIDAYEKTELGRINVGRAPEGVTVSADGLTLYAHNFMDRSITVVDLSKLINEAKLEFPKPVTVNVVDNESLSSQVLTGKQFFYDAKDTRLARDAYISCASCHNDGGQDGRVWDFTGLGEGLRNTISLEGRAGAQGRLHWSGNFDEVQDFENQIRGLAGGSGLMSNADFSASQATLGIPKAGLSSDLDALAAYVASLTEIPASPYRSNGSFSSAALAGKTVFETANCTTCHGGNTFSDSATNNLHDVGTLKSSSGNRLGGPLTGIDTPGLRGVWSSAPYLHDGSAATLQDAIRAHTSGLASSDIDSLITYLKEIENEVSTTSGYRYVKLEAYSEVDGKPWASAAEINILGSNGTPLNRSNWTVSTDSEETDGLATYALDGNPYTIWHTQWRSTSPTYPHWISIDMGSQYTLGGLSYLPRQTGSTTGTIADYRIYVSNDGVNWGTPISEGQFANDRSEKTVRFSTF